MKEYIVNIDVYVYRHEFPSTSIISPRYNPFSKIEVEDISPTISFASFTLPYIAAKLLKFPDILIDKNVIGLNS